MRDFNVMIINALGNGCGYIFGLTLAFVSAWGLFERGALTLGQECMICITMRREGERK